MTLIPAALAADAAAAAEGADRLFHTVAGLKIERRALRRVRRHAQSQSATTRRHRGVLLRVHRLRMLHGPHQRNRQNYEEEGLAATGWYRQPAREPRPSG